MSTREPLHPVIAERQRGIRGSRCGCFYCLKIFDGIAIADWVDHGQTALCPHCGIDSIISEHEGYEVTEAELARRRLDAFGDG